MQFHLCLCSGSYIAHLQAADLENGEANQAARKLTADLAQARAAATASGVGVKTRLQTAVIA